MKKKPNADRHRDHRHKTGICRQCSIPWDKRTPGCFQCRRRHQKRRQVGALPSLTAPPGRPRGGKIEYTVVEPLRVEEPI
jgi:hypothetical protein